MDWEVYFEIYPFSQDREDERFAMLAAVIANMSGKTLARAVSERVFMPNHLGHPPMVAQSKSLEQQHAEFREFTARYRATVKEAKRVT
ncbi:MAG TPA: hypothetical protein VI755_11580 [Anaerolineales bacterium]|nr:hypothetical protein [Anaerolineales bacterium]